MQTSYPIALWPIAGVVLLAAIIDFRTHRIPNWLVLPFLLAGLASSAYSNGWSGLSESVLGVLTAAVALGVFCYLGGMGMGDLKLCAAIGSWIGPSQMAAALVFTGLAGGVMAVGWAVQGRFLRQTLSGLVSLVSGFARKGLKPHETLVLSNPLTRRMPYAPAIAIGTLWSFVAKH
ncbi:MAG: type prepilin leader peptidase family protein [Bryobacterales bacterium]|nr:type prepilin leader peptidase family protein [Bryobacterales bacterium]